MLAVGSSVALAILTNRTPVLDWNAMFPDGRFGRSVKVKSICESLSQYSTLIYAAMDSCSSHVDCPRRRAPPGVMELGESGVNVNKVQSGCKLYLDHFKKNEPCWASVVELYETRRLNSTFDILQS